METEKVFDAVIIGGGPAGYSAAVHLAQLGGNACLIEQETVGGVCARVGCIPTKSLLAHAAFLSAMSENVPKSVWKEQGTHRISFLREGAEQAVQKSQQAAEYLLKQNKIRVISGRARIRSLSNYLSEIEVESGKEGNKVIRTKQTILATGSSPIILQNTPISSRVITSDQVLQLFNNPTFPKSVIIVGGGYIGLEFASLFRLLGTAVTIVEALPQLLSQEDQEVSSFMSRTFSAGGVALHCNEAVQEIREEDDHIIVKTRMNGQPTEKEYTAEIVLLAMGRRPNIAAEELHRLGIGYTTKGITTDTKMRTSVGSVFAAGDVAGRYQLAHVAAEEGKVAAENCLGLDSNMDYSIIPRCIFTQPEIASVGTQTAVQGKSFFLSNGKAMAFGSSQGFVKVYISNRKLAGATIVGEQASELIAIASPLIGRDISEIKKIIFAHPTRAEAIGEALRNVNSC